MDFLEPGDKDLVVNPVVTGIFYLEYTSGEISISHCLGFLVSLVLFCC